MKKDLASLLLAHPEDSSMRYLYECMYGVPMPGTEENPLPRVTSSHSQKCCLSANAVKFYGMQCNN